MPVLLQNKDDSSTVHRWSVGSLTYGKAALALLFCWLLWGDFAWSLKERAIFPSMQIMFRKVDASDFLTGLLLGTVPAAISLFLAPWIGSRSDRCRSKWGRRIPYLILPTPFIVLAMVGIAYAPEIGSALNHWLGAMSPGKSASTLCTLGALWLFFEVGTIVANTVFTGLVNDVVPHCFLGRFFSLFRALSLLAGIAFNFWIMGQVESHYRWIFIGIGLIYAVGMGTMCLNVREGNYPPPEPTSNNAISSIGEYLSRCFGNSYYLLFFAGSMLAAMALTPSYLFNIYYAKDLGMGMDSYGKCVAATYTISLIIAYPLGICVDRYHPLLLIIPALALNALVNLCGALFVTDASTLALAFVGQGVCAGLYWTIGASLAPMLLPKERFLEYASAMGLLVGLGTMLTHPLLGYFLDATGHQYRFLFWIAGGIAALSTIAFICLYRRFQQLGGRTGYCPPT